MIDFQFDTFEDTSGFYRIDENGEFHWAQNFVRAPDYDLFREQKDTYTYPTPGNWLWFDDHITAKAHFGIVDPPTVEETVNTLLADLDDEHKAALLQALGSTNGN
jgi:hypothetical protein